MPIPRCRARQRPCCSSGRFPASEPTPASARSAPAGHPPRMRSFAVIHGQFRARRELAQRVHLHAIAEHPEITIRLATVIEEPERSALGAIQGHARAQLDQVDPRIMFNRATSCRQRTKHAMNLPHLSSRRQVFPGEDPLPLDRTLPHLDGWRFRRTAQASCCWRSRPSGSPRGPHGVAGASLAPDVLGAWLAMVRRRCRSSARSASIGVMSRRFGVVTCGSRGKQRPKHHSPAGFPSVADPSPRLIRILPVT
jgi:hypothetical protein